MVGLHARKSVKASQVHTCQRGTANGTASETSSLVSNVLGTSCFFHFPMRTALLTKSRDALLRPGAVTCPCKKRCVWFKDKYRRNDVVQDWEDTQPEGLCLLL